MSKHPQSYWEGRYVSGQTGWNIGYASTPIQDFANKLPSKSLKILIPGAGNAYEAEHLHRKGFTDVHILDFALQPLEAFKARVPDFPASHVYNQDFFEHSGQYDIVLEQTFFCALDPILRVDYVTKMHELLHPEGILAGLLFNISFAEDKPPYGGHESIYRPLFSKKFLIQEMSISKNSIPSRLGNELFVIMKPLH